MESFRSVERYMRMAGQLPGGGNSMVRDWVAAEHEGPYDRRYGRQQDEGDAFAVDQGQLTFDAEGRENPGGRFHSRVPHVPGGASGVTIGRGYDIGQHTAAGTVNDLTAAGISPEQAEAYAGASGRSGQGAAAWLSQNRGALGEITPEQQAALFGTTYGEHLADVERISNKDDVVEAYGASSMDRVDPAIRDLFVDLRYRGDYHGTSRRHVQQYAVGNDLPGLAEDLADRDLWASVPQDRFDRRRLYAEEAVEEREIERGLLFGFRAPLEHLGDPNYDLCGNRRPDSGE